jgi:hypothetical protein
MGSKNHENDPAWEINSYCTHNSKKVIHSANTYRCARCGLRNPRYSPVGGREEEEEEEEIEVLKNSVKTPIRDYSMNVVDLTTSTPPPRRAIPLSLNRTRPAAPAPAPASLAQFIPVAPGQRRGEAEKARAASITYTQSLTRKNKSPSPPTEIRVLCNIARFTWTVSDLLGEEYGSWNSPNQAWTIGIHNVPMNSEELIGTLLSALKKLIRREEDKKWILTEQEYFWELALKQPSKRADTLLLTPIIEERQSVPRLLTALGYHYPRSSDTIKFPQVYLTYRPTKPEPLYEDPPSYTTPTPKIKKESKRVMKKENKRDVKDTLQEKIEIQKTQKMHKRTRSSPDDTLRSRPGAQTRRKAAAIAAATAEDSSEFARGVKNKETEEGNKEKQGKEEGEEEEEFNFEPSDILGMRFSPLLES